MSNGLNDDVPSPRLCHIIKWPDFDGYGFNLHAEKTKPGQYIGKVDKGSPSEAAGLKNGDKIVEVNGVNIANENHKQVVNRIKAIPNETKLLVLDPPADAYYRSKNVIVKGTMPNIQYMKTPSRNESEEGDEMDRADTNGDAETHSQTSERSSTSSAQVSRELPVDKVSDNDSLKGSDKKSDLGSNDKRSDKLSDDYCDKETDVILNDNGLDKLSDKVSSRGSTTATPSSDRHPSVSSTPEPPINYNNENSGSYDSSPKTNAANGNSPNQNDDNSLNLNMSVKEMRARLAARKKYDPKKENMDFRKKHEIVQTL